LYLSVLPSWLGYRYRLVGRRSGSGFLATAIEIPLVNFGPVKLKPPRQVCDVGRAPIRITLVLSLKELVLLPIHASAMDFSKWFWRDLMLLLLISIFLKEVI
jgi:hypothetical protein